MRFADTHRAALHARLRALVTRSEQLDHHLRGNDGRLDADFEDRAAFVEGDEVIEALDESTRAEVAAIKAALARLDAGVWEDCASCGAPIGHARLRAVPTTPLCVACASR